MTNEKNMSYEQSVEWMRSQPELAELVKFCYLDRDNTVAAKRFAASEEFAAILQILGVSNSSTALNILDLGCGNGIVSYAFAALGHHVQAVDPDTSNDVGLGAIERLMEMGVKGSIVPVEGFAESLPFEDGNFDVVYTRQAVHHFADLQAGLNQCARVLKTGGKFLATREHIVDDEQQLKIFLDNHILHKLHGGENAYPLERYLAALQTAGLKVTRNFAHFDTIINHFPVSNAEIARQSLGKVGKKMGKIAPLISAKLPFIESSHRARLSKTFDSPGRLHSFLAIK